MRYFWLNLFFNQIKQKTFFFFGLIFFTQCSISIKAQSLFTQKQLIEDFDYLIKSIEQTHPEPYINFGGKMNFHKTAHEKRNQISANGMNLNDFYFLISGFVAKLHDGHTYVSEKENNQNKIEEKYLPLTFKCISDGFFVQSASTDLNYLLGAKLLAVNGVDIFVLLEKVQNYSPCENISGAYFVLQKMINRLSSFSKLFSENNNKFEFLFQLPDLSKKNCFIEFVPDSKLGTKVHIPILSTINQHTDCDFNYQFVDKEKKVGYFGFYSVYGREVYEFMRQYNMDAQKAIDHLFKTRYKNIEQPKEFDKALKFIPSFSEAFYNLLVQMRTNNSSHLIIDLRLNSGGWTEITKPSFLIMFGDKYFEYNCKAELNLIFSELFLKKYNLSDIKEYNEKNHTNYKLGDYRFGYFYGYTDTLSTNQKRQLYLNNIKNISSFKLIDSLKGNAVYTPKKIIVLCSHQTFSAAFHFMYFLKEIGNAVIIGAPSRQAGNSGMEVTPFELPNTHLKGSISSSYQLFYPKNYEKGKMLLPDFLINWNDCKKYNFDYHSEIMYVLDLIKQGKI